MKRLLTVEDLCEILQVKKSWVYEKIKEGKIPIVPNMGRYKRFDPEVINELFCLSKKDSLKTEYRKAQA